MATTSVRWQRELDPATGRTDVRATTDRSSGRAASGSRNALAWRPFPEEADDVLCIQERGPDLPPRMHARFAVTLVRSGSVVRVESSRRVVADTDGILLVPASHLHSVRAQHGASPSAITLLLGAHHLEGCDIGDRPAIVVDSELDERVATLVAQSRLTLRPVESATTIRSLLDRLAARSTPLPVPPARRATPLAPIREYFRAHLDEQVTTAELAKISGLTEWHVIRAFHREFGLPPHAYHLRLRLASACELLSHGVSVSTTAYECGFSDQSHLSRKFKEVYGLTPAAWAAVVGDAGSAGWSPRATIAYQVPRDRERRNTWQS
jgi:AraC-like DNA-binding protein